MKLTRNYLIIFLLLSYAGGFYLRWYQLEFFYRILPTYFSGIGSTLFATFVLMLTMGSYNFVVLNRFTKVIKKIKNGEKITDEERKMAIRSQSKINIISLITNMIGFGVGQAFAIIVDIKNEVIVFVPSRITLIMIQAILIGCLIAIFEIFIVGVLMRDDRRLLKIHSVDELDHDIRFSIKYKIIFSSVVILGLMGLQCFCLPYQIIFGDCGAPVEDMMSEYLRHFPKVFIATFIPCIALVYVLASDIKSRIQHTAVRVRDIGSKGDLTSRIDIAMHDDIGALSTEINLFMKDLASMVQDIKTETYIVENSAENLSESLKVSNDALSNMKQTAEKIMKEGELQKELVENARDDVVNVTRSVLDVEQQIEQQTASVRNSSSSVSEMAENIEAVAELAQQADTVSTSLKEASEKGEGAIKTAVNAIMEIQTASNEVQDIVKVIQKIASQTNLLSMNAAIEAAHAGAIGQGFAVVADEVRSLASSSSVSAKNIAVHIKDMVGKIQNGVESIQQAGNAFTEINAGIANTSDLVRTIAHSMEAQRIGANDTIKSTESVVASIELIQSLTKQQHEFAENVESSINKIVNASQEIAASLEKNTENSRKLECAIDGVDSCVTNNSMAVSKMLDCINVFNV
ncbi:MAG: methyl-accepting chemotaxis protein [Spirochaetaceae bacterium]|nr:methyl-accepting chemotaxis protein [Spirochaetaceae bacterium]